MFSPLLIDGRVAVGAFDFDGNILAPETITYVIDRVTEEEVGIPAHTLDQNPHLMNGDTAQYRWKDDIIDSLIHFRDYHSDTKHLGPDQFKLDIEQALANGAFSPSTVRLKEIFLIPARLFAIITARGHSPDNIARILWIMNETILSVGEKQIQYQNILALYRAYTRTNGHVSRDQALRFYFEDIVSYYPISNPHIAKYLQISHEPSMPRRKSLAMTHYIANMRAQVISHLGLTGYPLAIGFSDDSVSNIITMVERFTAERASGILGDDTVHIYFTGKHSESEKLESLGLQIEHGITMSTIRI